MYLNINKMFRLCIRIMLLCTLSVFIPVIFCVKPNDIHTYREMEIIDDLPVKIDMEKYLSKLEDTIAFVNNNKVYVDLNLYFGLFVVKVNLKSSLKSRGKNRGLLPAFIRTRLENLLKTNDAVVEYFTKMTKKFIVKLGSVEQRSVGLLDLISNEATWMNKLANFSLDLFKKTKYYSRKKLKEIYFDWADYFEKVFDVDIFSPSPNESDTCLTSLAQNPVNREVNMTHCHVPYKCAHLVNNGTHFGYGITHRLLFLLLTRFSRNCAIFSDADDAILINQLCATIYNEAEYIAHFDFEIPDLILEQISLCTLVGHAQFLRRSWIDELLDFQTSYGCFNVTRPRKNFTLPKFKSDGVSWEFLSTNEAIMNGACNGHMTGVASAALASAIRFIMETFY
ncbi:uncharacterized protein LOC142978587 [Anticarsia gemmatalis]|uniref:uncharacterized protein LOC142978587 n=1 Tax=Anticarsia gemmatalis TaxID=129554 RepID=UPI003F769BC4